MSRRLPHVEERLALQVMRADLVRDHDRPPPSSQSGSCRHAPGLTVLSSWSVTLVSPSAARTTPACRRSSSAVLLRTGRSAAARGVAPASASSDVAWTSPRFWSRESPVAPESGVFDDAKQSFSACCSSAASAVSAARSTWASAAIRTWRTPRGRTNIHARTLSQRSASEPLRLQRNNAVRLADRLVSADPKTKPRMPMDIKVPETRFRGRCQAFLYNTVRPHASLGYRPPALEVFVPAIGAWPAAHEL